MAARIIRSRTVLDCLGGGFGDVDFGQHPNASDENADGNDTRVSIPRRKWLDLGAPGQLTVTIEPGNTLDPRSQS